MNPSTVSRQGQARENLSWICQDYDALMQKYGGKYVLFTVNEIVFADETFETVYVKYNALKEKTACRIALIEDGEASFYAFEITSQGTQT